MDKRKQIGLYYFFDKSWLGGVYYAQNLIMALNTLPDSEKPIVNAYCYTEESYEDLRKNTLYPYLKYTRIEENKWKVLLRNILILLNKKTAGYVNLFHFSKDDSIIFPYGWGTETDKLLYWIPDLQFKHYPNYFSKKDIWRKDAAIKSVCRRGVPIVFSSNDSLNDFKRFYPEFSNHKTFVVHFAVSKPIKITEDIELLKSKFKISGQYLMCTNQFWQHKNHLFLFRAFKVAIENGLNMQLVCTGRLNDQRNPKYIEEIKHFIQDNNLQERILLLGIIEKSELYSLMQYSYAVVQPSLFEGWNTTVEDCKSMSKFIFLSDLGVHREQISKNVCFFNPHDEKDLALKLCHVSPDTEKVDYRQNVYNFGKQFSSIINKK